MQWKKTGEEGLLTVEAILGLVPFILVILGIISFIAFYGAQRSPFCFRTAAFRSQRPPIF